MNRNELIKNKLLSQYPESFKIFEDSCWYSVKHGLDFIKGVLLYREKEVGFNEFNSVWEQLSFYLNDLGYNNLTASHKDIFLTKKGYEQGLVFIVFLSKSAIESYIEENKRWSKSIEGNIRGQVEAKRPIYDSIRSHALYTDPHFNKKIKNN